MTQTPLFTALFGLVLLPALWGSGVFAGFHRREQSTVLAGVFTLSLGLIVYGHVLMLAGLLNRLNPPIVLIFLAFVFAWYRTKTLEFFFWVKATRSFLLDGGGRLTGFCRWSLIFTLLFTFTFCFLPEIANDALAIQLYVAKLFVQNHSLAPSYFDIASYRPLVMSVLYATGLFFKNISIAKLFHWLCGFLLTLALIAKIEEKTKSKVIALFCGVALWLTPTLINQITTTYIDAGVALFIFLGYCMTIEKLKDLRTSDFFYGGLFLGMAVAARYLALGAVFAILMIGGRRLFVRAERGRAFAAGIACMAGALITSGFWFCRAWIYTGNPIYPYLGSLFGTEDYSLFSSIYFHGMGLPRSIGTFLGIPLDITFRPQYFDYHHWVGPVYLLLLPFAVYAAIKNATARQHLVFAFLFTTFWYFTGQNVRYLLPTFPVYLLACSLGLSELQKKLSLQILTQKFAKLAAFFLTLSLLSLSIYHFRYQFLPILRVWSIDEYAAKMERTIPAAAWINSHLTPTAKLLILDEPRIFYFDRPVILDYDFDIRTKYKLLHDSAQMARVLKHEGISHILDMIPLGLNQRENRPIDSVLTNSVFVNEEAVIESVNIRDTRYRYTLYSLK